MTKENILPWQNYPEKFIRFAGKFENTNDDFERLVGYLLLDVGVEALLKAFVLADTSLKYSERESSAKGMVGKDSIPDSKITAVNFEKITFHNLLETVKLAAKSKVTEEDLKNAEHYHGIRNIIYHEGRKTIPSGQDFKDYLGLANSLLSKLLETDKLADNVQTLEEMFSQAFRETELHVVTLGLPAYFHRFQFIIAVASEFLDPKYTSRRLEKSLQEIQLKYPSDNDSSPAFGYKNQQGRIKSFKRLTNEDVNDITFIDKVIADITYLHLSVLHSHKIVDDNDINNYVEYRSWIHKLSRDPNNASREERERLLQIKDKAGETEKKLVVFIKSKEQELK